MDIVKIRKHLHQHPEVSDKEEKTAKYIRKLLDESGDWKITDKIGGHGIWALYDTGKEGPHVAFRAELDALPITETGNPEHKSENEGVSHVCGHDGHMSILMGLAHKVQQQKIKKGKISLVFQPAEETGQGAERMMEDKKFDDFKPDYFFAIHNLPGIKKHKIVCKEGVLAAASIGMKVKLKGVGGHAGNPNLSVSPVKALGKLIKKAPLYKVDEKKGTFDIVSIIHVNAGELSFGTIPSEAVFAATLRSSHDDGLEKLKKNMSKFVEEAAEAHQVKFEIEWLEWFPAVVNKKSAFDLLKKAISSVDADFKEPVSPFRWSEDFGLFSKRYETALFGVGAGKKQPPLHQSDYDFPDDIMENVINIYLEIIKQAGCNED